MTGKRTDDVLQSVARLSPSPEFGIDVFKLESPVAAKSRSRRAATPMCRRHLTRWAGLPGGRG
jgi:hypothetical protein